MARTVSEESSALEKRPKGIGCLTVRLGREEEEKSVTPRLSNAAAVSNISLCSFFCRRLMRFSILWRVLVTEGWPWTPSYSRHRISASGPAATARRNTAKGEVRVVRSTAKEKDFA